MIKGTIGANLESDGGPSKIEGYHMYNENTGFNSFSAKNGRVYRTRFKLNVGQRDDIDLNCNMM